MFSLPRFLFICVCGILLVACAPKSTSETVSPVVSPIVSPVVSSMSSNSPQPSPFASYSARFMIFTHGTKRIFTDTKYHQQSAAVYLTAADPSVVHIEQPDLTWADFFGTLPFSLTKECLITGTKQTFCQSETQQLSFYLNGELTPDALGRVIKPGDKLLVTVSANPHPNLDAELGSF